MTHHCDPTFRKAPNIPTPPFKLVQRTGARPNPRRIVALLCPAVMACASAQAQSSVTAFGVLDSGIQRLSASGANSQTSIISDGNSSSRFGFRGAEDLGGGTKAGFWLEGAFAVDTGVGGTASTNNKDSAVASLFGRRSTVSLLGPWGELRVGRDQVPSFLNLASSSHPFGTNGVGSSGLLFYPVNAGGTSVRTNVRASNSVGYLLPDLAGFSGQVMYALGEQAAPGPTKSDGRYAGVNLAYKTGALGLAAGLGKTEYATGDFEQANVAVNYKIGPAKLMALWGQNKVGSTKTTAMMFGTQWDIGSGQIRAAYTHLDAARVANDASHLALGYVHNLSKRTGLYATWAQIDNKHTGRTFGVGLPPAAAGGKSTGYEAGLRHNF